MKNHLSQRGRVGRRTGHLQLLSAALTLALLSLCFIGAHSFVRAAGTDMFLDKGSVRVYLKSGKTLIDYTATDGTPVLGSALPNPFVIGRKNKDQATANTISIEAGVGELALTLDGVDSASSKASPLDLANDVALTLNMVGASTLTALPGGENIDNPHAALHVPRGASLVIDSGKLTAHTQDYLCSGAAIGSDNGEACGSITVNDGQLEVTTEGSGAAIGSGGKSGGSSDVGPTITITGGTINLLSKATFGETGACLGGGNAYSDDLATYGGKICIHGGNVTANLIGNPVNAEGPACIGGGVYRGVDILIDGNAVVNATSTGAMATIGSGTGLRSSLDYKDDLAKIVIAGSAVVNAHAKSNMSTIDHRYYPSGAAIGAATNDYLKWNILIGGSSTVHAVSELCGAGIGGGYNQGDPVLFGNVHITDSATVKSTGGQYAAGIGGGYRTSGKITIDGTAKVDAYGGLAVSALDGAKPAAAIGSGVGSPVCDVILADQATVLAIGGNAKVEKDGSTVEVPAIGVSETGGATVSGAISIGSSVKLTAYATGKYFAIDSRPEIDLSGVKNMLLNARFAPGEVTPVDPAATDGISPVDCFRMTPAAALQKKLALPAGYRAFAVNLVPRRSATVYRLQDGSDLNMGAYYTDDESATPPVNAVKHFDFNLKPGEFLHKDFLRWGQKGIYTLIFDLAGGEGEAPAALTDLSFDASIPLSKPPTRAGYRRRLVRGGQSPWRKFQV